MLAGTGSRCCTRWSRATQTCSMGDMSGEYACVLPSALYSWNCYLQHASGHRSWAFAHLSRWRCRTAVRSNPWWERRAHRWESLRLFLKFSAQIIWLCKPTVSSAVQVAGFRWSHRWRSWMWRSWAGVVTRGLLLWGGWTHCQIL
jgi:hypothetical protein